MGTDQENPQEGDSAECDNCDGKIELFKDDYCGVLWYHDSSHDSRGMRSIACVDGESTATPRPGTIKRKNRQKKGVSMKHPISTVNVPGYVPQTLNLLVGCKGHSCKPHCWYFNRIVPRMNENPKIKCPLCKTGEPHTHFFERADKLPKKPHVYFQDMGEPNDFHESDIIRLQKIYARHPQHIFQLLTHFPMEFYTKYPTWGSNVWAMGTFTKGEIRFPRELRAGQIVAYCEPIRQEILIDPFSTQPTWVVIGAQTGKNAVRPKLDWIKQLVYEFQMTDIPIHVKPHPVWDQIGLFGLSKEIQALQQFPKER